MLAYFQAFVTLKKIKIVLSIGSLLGMSTPLFALSANWVHFEFRPECYRITIGYTIPELRIKKEAVIEKKIRREAEKIFWKLQKGGEFYLMRDDIVFPKSPKGPTPW